MSDRFDAWAWIQRWEAQQERYLPHREERFSLMLDLIGHTLDTPRRVLDLGCGNGALSRRLLERYPDVSIVAVDMDPVHLELGRRTLGTRIDWRDGDLRGDGWDAGLDPGSFDAAVSATALHWLQSPDLVRLYRRLANLLRENGLFLNADHQPVGSPTIARESADLLERWQDVRLEGQEDHAGFHAAAAADPTLASFAQERERRFADKPPGDEPGIAFHHEALLTAGFSEAGEAWRFLSDTIHVAVR